MLALSLLWIVIGLLIGALAVAGQVIPVKRRSFAWPLLLAIGVPSALLGGWLGTIVYGRFFGTATAVWVATLAVIILPWTLNRLRF